MMHAVFGLDWNFQWRLQKQLKYKVAKGKVFSPKNGDYPKIIAFMFITTKWIYSTEHVIISGLYKF